MSGAPTSRAVELFATFLIPKKAANQEPMTDDRYRLLLLSCEPINSRIALNSLRTLASRSGHNLNNIVFCRPAQPIDMHAGWAG